MMIEGGSRMPRVPAPHNEPSAIFSKSSQMVRSAHESLAAVAAPALPAAPAPPLAVLPATPAAPAPPVAPPLAVLPARPVAPELLVTVCGCGVASLPQCKQPNAHNTESA